MNQTGVNANVVLVMIATGWVVLTANADVLVTTSGRRLEGKVTEIGNIFILKDKTGGQTYVPKEKVKEWIKGEPDGSAIKTSRSPMTQPSSAPGSTPDPRTRGTSKATTPAAGGQSGTATAAIPHPPTVPAAGEVTRSQAATRSAKDPATDQALGVKPTADDASRHAGSLRKIPLVIRSYGLGLPDVSGQGDSGKVKSRCEVVSDGVYADAPVVAAGFRLVGQTYGYDFNPIKAVEKGETPKVVVSNLPEKPEFVLLIGCKISVPQRIHGIVLCTVWVEAALFTLPSWEPVVSSGFMSPIVVDPKEITGDEVNSGYLAKEAMRVIKQDGGKKVLAKVQGYLDRK